MHRPPACATRRDRPATPAQRVAPQIRRRERQRIQELDFSIGHDQQHRLRAGAPPLHFGEDVPGVDEKARGVSSLRPFSQPVDGFPPLSVVARNAVQAAAARPMRIIGPVTKASQPRATAKSKVWTAS